MAPNGSKQAKWEQAKWHQSLDSFWQNYMNSDCYDVDSKQETTYSIIYDKTSNTDFLFGFLSCSSGSTSRALRLRGKLSIGQNCKARSRSFSFSTSALEFPYCDAMLSLPIPFTGQQQSESLRCCHASHLLSLVFCQLSTLVEQLTVFYISGLILQPGVVFYRNGTMNGTCQKDT